MRTMEQWLDDADRLTLVTQRVGFALWQIQELEAVAAQFFVLVTQATPGMGADAGNLLIDKAERNTFGATVSRIAKAGLLDADLEERLRALLSERNWLVHRSRRDSRNAVRVEAAARKLVFRLHAMAEESNAILKCIGELAEQHVLSIGVPTERIDEIAARLLDEWHAADAV